MQADGVELDALSSAARQILYYWPQFLDRLPPGIVAAGRATVDSGRAARRAVDGLFM